ncbi:MAG: hypothetical protein J2P36_18125 [Ktedonobacteraceae bacterium]|nr:hypothetical protein [Ktedonobacteraceae bacterium]
MTDANSVLLSIQRLQFVDPDAATKLLLGWFELYMDLKVDRVRLVPKAVSLNSFNGFYTLDGEEYFFKTHVEELGVDQEYYNAQVLHDANYNIVLPLRTIHRFGMQMVIYPVIRWPEIFTLARAIETGGETGGITVEQVIEAERRECERLLQIYDATLAPATASEHARAPIHQLFWHRLAGERLTSFYAGKAVPWPDQRAGARLTFEDLLRYRWVINGTPIEGPQHTLGELIEQGKTVLNPERALHTVVGHGDAHFGNVFLEQQRRYLYFDPAFAGRHSPLLDIVKPLFHNVFAAWMYFGPDVARDLHITVETRGETLYIEHDYRPSALRQEILQVKLQRLVVPLLELLRGRNALPDDWSDILRMALMCCPLLTINLLERLPAPVCWLGLSYVMQMGVQGAAPPAGGTGVSPDNPFPTF